MCVCVCVCVCILPISMCVSMYVCMYVCMYICKSVVHAPLFYFLILYLNEPAFQNPQGKRLTFQRKTHYNFNRLCFPSHLEIHTFPTCVSSVYCKSVGDVDCEG